jgi:hypothetical protein
MYGRMRQQASATATMSPKASMAGVYRVMIGLAHSPLASRALLSLTEGDRPVNYLP